MLIQRFQFSQELPQVAGDRIGSNFRPVHGRKLSLELSDPVPSQPQTDTNIRVAKFLEKLKQTGIADRSGAGVGFAKAVAVCFAHVPVGESATFRSETQSARTNECFCCSGLK